MAPKMGYDTVFRRHGAIFTSNNIPGAAKSVHAIKKPRHPIASAMKPVGADANTLGTPMRLLNSAYWVAVNRLSVMLAI